MGPESPVDSGGLKRSASRKRRALFCVSVTALTRMVSGDKLIEL